MLHFSGCLFLPLSGEGVLDSECRLLSKDVTRMDRAVFKVSISYQYSAAKELKEYISGASQ
jgi:hypothetical protein